MIQAIIVVVYIIIGCIVADQCGDGDIVTEVLVALFWPLVVVLGLFLFIFWS